jgi:hypothetical protein
MFLVPNETLFVEAIRIESALLLVWPNTIMKG